MLGRTWTIQNPRGLAGRQQVLNLDLLAVAAIEVKIAFELNDLATGALVWTGLYEFSRAATDDVVYR